MTAVLTLCSVAGCPSLTDKGMCAGHRAAKSNARGSSGWERQAERNAYLAMHPFCVICNQPATVMDHIVRIVDGGAREESNYQSLCKQCDDRKQEWEGGRARR